MLKRVFFAIALLWMSMLSASALENPVTWTVECKDLTDNQVEVVVSAYIEAGWHLYSQHQEGMALPLTFKTSNSQQCTWLTEGLWSETPMYEESYNAIFNETERFINGKATFTTRLQRLTPDAFTATIQVEGQACKMLCVPIDAELTLHVPAIEKQQVSSVLNEQAKDDTASSLWWFFLLAFGGGLLGILTPCVFPMVPMTVSYFMKNGGKKQALFYGMSIVLIYMLFGIVLSAIFGQDFANIISTHWLPNCLFAVIFILFAFSLLGYFEITLPNKWVNKSAGMENKAGYLGTFFMALTLVLVSFSCTLPIAGAVALGAADGSFVKPIVGMLGFSLAFALPFTLFAFFPGWLKKLPKSGGWMNTLKVTLAFVELAFALKFLSVPDQAYHWGILDREVYLALWIVIFALLGMYLLGKLRFPLDDEYGVQRSPIRFATALAVWVFVIYMLPGMWGAPLNALSGWLPPMSSQDFVIGGGCANATTESIAANTGPLVGNIGVDAENMGVGTMGIGTLSGTINLHTVKGLSAVFDYDEAVALAKAQNKPVFLDFTGHGCVNCRQVEQLVLSRPEVQTLINNQTVMAALYVDDKVVELSSPYFTHDAKLLTLLGDKNRYIQHYKFKENAQPCYLMIDPNTEQVLAGPLFYETNPAVFMQFLLQGVDAMKR
ncbi:MAG: thioredoxin family protein [Paludibacteraceae bacterium]|nr:thioredoxin family protein [Paludibacteraceae bacterium]